MNIIETPQFKKWFAGSKVVDANGNPLVVYHATKKSFNVFDPTVGEFGCHFGTLSQADDVYKHEKDIKNLRIIPCFLCIKNPIKLRDIGEWYDHSVLSYLYKNYRKDFPDITPTDDYEFETETDIISLIREAGYDGVVYLNRHEGVPKRSKVTGEFRADYTFENTHYIEDDKFMEVFPEASLSYIAFDPRQIKSVYGNSEYNSKKAEYGESLAGKVLKLCSK